MALPHGAGRLLWEEFHLDQGVKVTVSNGWLDKPISMRGRDTRGLDIAFQLGVNRRVTIDDRHIVDEPQPVFSIYKSAGGQSFEIVEQPTRDAAFVEFSFSPGAVERLCPALDRSVNALLKEGRDVGSALLFKRALSPAMAEAARRLARPDVMSKGSRPLAAKRDAFALLGLLTDEPVNGEPLSDASRALQAAEILRAQLADPPDLATLAKAVGLKPYRLSAAFRAEFNMTPSMFVRSERMQRASDRLRSGSAHIASLAWELGYRSTSHFVQAFRSWHGVTPARFGRMESGSKNDILSD